MGLRDLKRTGWGGAWRLGRCCLCGVGSIEDPSEVSRLLCKLRCFWVPFRGLTERDIERQYCPVGFFYIQLGDTPNEMSSIQNPSGWRGGGQLPISIGHIEMPT